MQVKFFGTRGSIATPGERTLRYGGNTSCVAVRSRTGTLVVIDAGTGAAVLGRELAATGMPVSGHVLLSHTHWDHIQGIPFFTPFFVPGNNFDIYAPRGLGKNLRETLAGQMQYTYFPVTLEELGASIRYRDLVEGSFTLGDIAVTARYLHHPALTLGFRLEADGATLVYACDHEPHARSLADGRGEIIGEDRRHAEFLRGADLVIHDAQYLAGEYEKKIGWGHSTAEYALAVARFAGVKRLALTHHDPARDDAAVDAFVARLKAEAGAGAPEIFAAAEGQSVDIAAAGAAATPKPAASALQPMAAALADRSVLLALEPGKRLDLLREAAEADQIAVLTAAPADAAAVAARERPSLVLLGDESPDAADICRAIRAIPGYGAELPVVLVTKESRLPAETAPFSDRLVAPFSPTYARTRLRAWIMRAAARWTRPVEPADEIGRLAETRALGLFDTPLEERFDRLTRLAARLFEVPIALITLVDAERQWFKSAHGLDERETPRDQSFCAHAVHARDTLVVPDALADDRFADNPLVTGPPRIRFYAGEPLRLANGTCVGTLCLIDVRPRDLDAGRLALLHDLAAVVSGELLRAA